MERMFFADCSFGPFHWARSMCFVKSTFCSHICGRCCWRWWGSFAALWIWINRKIELVFLLFNYEKMQEKKTTKHLDIKRSGKRAWYVCMTYLVATWLEWLVHTLYHSELQYGIWSPVWMYNQRVTLPMMYLVPYTGYLVHNTLEQMLIELVAISLYLAISLLNTPSIQRFHPESMVAVPKKGAHLPVIWKF